MDADTVIILYLFFGACCAWAAGIDSKFGLVTSLTLWPVLLVLSLIVLFMEKRDEP